MDIFEMAKITYINLFIVSGNYISKTLIEDIW